MQANHALQTNLINPSSITLINADGRKLTLLGTTTAMLDLGIVVVEHTLIVVEKLSTPFIFGCDFLTKLLHSYFNTGRQVAPTPNTLCMLVLDDEDPQALPSKAIYFITSCNLRHANRMPPCSQSSTARPCHAL